MRLSEAIRLGAMLHPQHRGSYQATDETGAVTATCAAAAAFEVAGCRPVPMLSVGGQALRGGGEPLGSMILGIEPPMEWRVILLRIFACPVCAREDTVLRQLAHLNDDHAWTRETIAEWIDTVDPAVVVEDVPSEARALPSLVDA